MAQLDLTRGPIGTTMIRFALPMIGGNILQQVYNIADTLIVGRVLGPDALAAVGSSFALMTFLTSVLLGLCMGSGAMFSIRYGENNAVRFQEDRTAAFALIAGITVILQAGAFVCLPFLLGWLSVPAQVQPLMGAYLWVIFWGIGGTFLSNYYTCLLRAVGNAFVPLVFLGGASAVNLGLDLVFVLACGWGVKGAAAATVLAQWGAGIGLLCYTRRACPQLRLPKAHRRLTVSAFREIGSASVLTCLQQSVMNLGILMVQGLVNSFGPVVMAAFAAAVKIDAFAYMPLQDFGNAFSTFIAQNYGAGQSRRIRQGIRTAGGLAIGFGLMVSLVVVLFARPLMGLFVPPHETEILSVGVTYLRIEGAFYWGIGVLFLLYGLYRAICRPGMSLILTVLSLGTRVALAYSLSALPAVGVLGIWWAVPIGWVLADLTGILRARALSRQQVQEMI